MNKVSIIIPNYNGSRYLRECLDSALRQEYNSYDIIIVDDDSNDTSVELVYEYQKKYKNITLLQNKKNKGVSYSRNIGVQAANSTYVAFLDSDDTVSRNWLSSIMDAIENESLDVCGCWLTTSNSKYKSTTYRVSVKHSEVVNELWFIGGNIGGLIVKKDLCLKFPFDTNVAIYEDRLFYNKLFNVTKKISNVQKKLYFYRRHTSNTTKKTNPPELVYSRVQNIPEKYRDLGGHIITLGAPITVKNIIISLYVGFATLTFKNYTLYIKLTMYYIWRKITRQ